MGQASPEIPLYPPLEKGERNPPLVKGGMGGFDRQSGVLRGAVPLAISQSFGDCHSLTAWQ